MGRPKSPPLGLTSVTLTEAVDRFIRSVEDSLVSESTIATKRSILNVMVDQLTPKFVVWGLTREILDDVFSNILRGAGPEEAAERKAKGRRSRRGRTTKESIAQARTALEQFLGFCHDRYWLAYDVKLVKPKVKGRQNSRDKQPPRRKPKAAHKDWPTILNDAGNFHARLRIAVALGLYLGRRISEICWMRWEDVEWDANQVAFYNQKGDRLGEVPLIPEMRAELMRYRDFIIERHGPINPSWFIVCGKLRPSEIRGAGSHVRIRQDSTRWPLVPSRKADVRAVYWENKKLLAKYGYGTGEGVGTHTWRKSGATHVADKYGIEVAQQLLAHAMPATTKRYTDNDDGKSLLWKALLPGVTPPISATMKLNNAESEPDLIDVTPDNVIPLRRRDRDEMAS